MKQPISGHHIFKSILVFHSKIHVHDIPAPIMAKRSARLHVVSLVMCVSIIQQQQIVPDCYTSLAVLFLQNFPTTISLAGKHTF